jgi:hypothetical protein
VAGVFPELPAYTVPAEDVDLMQAGCVLTRSRLHETWIYAGIARRCAVCQRVFWRVRRTKHVDRGGRLTPRVGAETELHVNEKYCGLASCRRAVARQSRNLAGVERKPTLRWMSTVAEAAAAMDVREEELLAFIERYAKPDLFGELVARLPGATVEAELLGERVNDPGLGRLLRQGIVCRRVAAWKKDNVPGRFHGRDGDLLTDWIVFVRSYEGKPAEDGDTGGLVWQQPMRGLRMVVP